MRVPLLALKMHTIHKLKSKLRLLIAETKGEKKSSRPGDSELCCRCDGPEEKELEFETVAAAGFGCETK